MPYDHTSTHTELNLRPAPDQRPEWAKTKREKRRAAQSLRPRRWPFVLVTLIAAGGLGAIQLQGASAPTDAVPVAAHTGDASAILIHPMDTTRITRSTLRETLRVTGALQPRTEVQVKSKASGTVKEVMVRLGDHVSAGQVLLQIDDEVLRNQVAQQDASLAAQQAQFALATTEAERAKQLAGRGVSTSASLESASSNLLVQKANLAQQEAALAAAQINLRDTAIIAPFNGIVAKRQVEPGQTLAIGDEVFELADLSQMTFESYVPVSSTLGLTQGQEVNFTIEGLQGQTFLGKIEGVSPTTSSGSRNAQVSILVDNPEGILRGGMFATGSIQLKSQTDAIAVPAAALREDGQGAYVLKIADGKLLRQGVESDGSWHVGKTVSITAGLQPGDEIVSGKLADLSAGMAVRVAEAP